MPTAMALAVRNESEDLLELDVYDVIGESWWDSVSAKSVRRQLKSSKAKTIKVRINSNGGDAFHGIAISNDLKNHVARVEVEVTGLAASAATIIMVAGDTIRVADNAMIMIHEAWTIALGGADDLKSSVSMLEKTNENLAATYAESSKKRGKNVSKDEFAKMMSATTWMSAEEAIDMGLADKQVKSTGKIAASLWSPALAKSAIPKAAAVAVLAGMKDHLAEVPEEQLEALRAAADEHEAPAPEPEQQPQPTPPVAQQPQAQQTLPLEGIPSREEPMAFTKLFAILNLSADADEDAAVAAVQKIQNSASVGNEVERIVGANGQTAIGVVRALKEGEARSQQLADEVETIKVKMARDQFEALRAQGCKDRKLTSTTAQFYADKFEASVKLQDDGTRNSDGSDVVADLEGFLKVAPRVVAAPVLQPSDDGSVVAASHGGKKFEEMKPFERHALKRDNPELYNSLRIDALERKAI